MRTLVAIVLLLTGLVLGGLAYSCYAEYRMASNVARYYNSNPDEVPSGESRDQRVAAELSAAERNRNQAALSAAGSVLTLLGGAALFLLGKSKTSPAIPLEGSSDRSARVVIARPIEVQVKGSHTILFASVMVFFAGISLLMIVINGLTSVSVLLVALNAFLLGLLYYLERRAKRNLAILFDPSGVTRGDKRQFDWSAFKGVDYLMAIKSRSGKEFLWRIELVFNDGNVWIIPRRTNNLDEIVNFVGTLPGTHQKRLA